MKLGMSIPMCPMCKKPTQRVEGVSSRTCVYYTPIYDKFGINTNPDMNKTTTDWYCSECGHNWRVTK